MSNPFRGNRSGLFVVFALIVGISIVLASLVISGRLFASNHNHPRTPSDSLNSTTLDELAARSLDATVPEYHQDNEGTDSYLLTPEDRGFEDQEDRAVADYTHFSTPQRAFPDDSWGEFHQPTPGMSIDIDGEFSCTLAFTGHYKDTGAPAALTAGHCMDSDSDGLAEWSAYPDGYPAEPLGFWDAMQLYDSQDVETGEGSARYNDQHIPVPGPIANEDDTDYATLSLYDPASVDQRIGGRYHVTAVAGAADLHKGMMVCKMGFRTKETCGPITAWNSSFVRANLFSMTGDSGSPLYIKLGDNKVAALGMLSGSPVNADDGTNDYVTDFALVQPALAAANMQLGS